MKIKSIVNSVYWNLYIRKLAFKWIFRKNLGDDVMYNGKVYTISNGVCYPSWDSNSHGVRTSIPNNKCRKVLTPKNLYRSYSYGVSFYTQNWLDIWKREGVKDWMKGCSIL